MVFKINAYHHKITELRVWADVYKKEGDALVQDEDKSEPVNVTIWQEHLGEDVIRLLSKGMRVVVKGELHIQTWQDKESHSNKHQVHVEAETDAMDASLPKGKHRCHNKTAQGK